jgi:hypothetical protein
MSRECNGCVVCCRELDVGAPIHCPAQVQCPNAVEGQGCTIYADRPAVCRSFECLWKQGLSETHPSVVFEAKGETAKGRKLIYRAWKDGRREFVDRLTGKHWKVPVGEVVPHNEETAVVRERVRLGDASVKS